MNQLAPVGPAPCRRFQRVRFHRRELGLTRMMQNQRRPQPDAHAIDRQRQPLLLHRPPAHGHRPGLGDPQSVPHGPSALVRVVDCYSEEHRSWLSESPTCIRQAHRCAWHPHVAFGPGRPHSQESMAHRRGKHTLRSHGYAPSHYAVGNAYKPCTGILLSEEPWGLFDS